MREKQDRAASVGARRLLPFIVFLAALAILGIGLESARVAETISDPIARFRSQDESLFANSAITMVLRGDWMTPKFLGRIYLYKPPLQLWLSAISMKLFGITLLGLRLPILLAGACGVALLFAWGRRTGSGLAAALLLLADPMWQIFSHIDYTDMLATVFIATALYLVARDPRLERPATIFGFALATAAAIMTKSAAGALPAVILVLFALVIRAEQRPRWTRIVLAGLWTIAFAAPWHIYELLMHRRWFWADYVGTQLLGYGTHPPFQLTSEFPLVFYAKRLFLTDPVLVILAVIALPALIAAARRRDTVMPVLLSVWLAIVVLALCGFQARGNFRWVLLLLPPLALLGSCFGPPVTEQRRKWLVALLCIAFAVKSIARSQPWGLPFGAAESMTALSALRAYSDQGRANPLVLVEADDELYSAVLPLPKIHYVWIDPTGGVQRLAPHYVDLGITVTAAEFDDLAPLKPQFRARLREWGVDSDEPIATSVVADSEADIPKIVAAHPEADYYLPARFLASFDAAKFDVVRTSDAHLFLLSHEKPDRPGDALLFSVPGNW